MRTASPLLQPLVAGLAFPEAPRWHQGALWSRISTGGGCSGSRRAVRWKPWSNWTTSPPGSAGCPQGSCWSSACCSAACCGWIATARTWARFEEKGVAPDGICLDADGAVWMASPVSREVLRVLEGGAVTHRVPTGEQATACALGGADGRTLYVTVGRVMVTPAESRAAGSGAVLQLPLDVMLAPSQTRRPD